MAREIRRREIDILIDMDGYSNEGIAVRSLFATRLAPVTASWFVYMATTGQDNVDYIVADKHVLPPHVAVHHSEAVLELPGPGTFFPISHASLFPDSPPAVLDAAATKDEWRTKHGLPLLANGRVVFASFNKHLKITPHVWASWMHVLHSVPGSVLLLLENPSEGVPQLREHFQRAGLSPERLLWCPFVNTAEEHIFRVAMVDVILDTPPWGAHTGCADALWCAVPVVTTAAPLWESDDDDSRSGAVALDSMASRVALSLLHAAGVPELVAASMAEYTATAVRLGRDPAWRAEVVAKLKAARAGPLFDAALYARTFVHGMHEMYAAACANSKGSGGNADAADAAQAGAAPQPAPRRRVVVPPVPVQAETQ